MALYAFISCFANAWFKTGNCFNVDVACVVAVARKHIEYRHMITSPWWHAGQCGCARHGSTKSGLASAAN